MKKFFVIAITSLLLTGCGGLFDKTSNVKETTKENLISLEVIFTGNIDNRYRTDIARFSIQEGTIYIVEYNSTASAVFVPKQK